MEPDKALSRAAALCSRSEQCESDIRAKLQQWEVEPVDADAIITRLLHEHFLDEQRYARAYVHDKFLYNGWGPVKLSSMLHLKGISSDSIAQALEQFSSNDYHNTLRRLLQGKWREVKGREPRLARAALLRFAASRGFDADTCYRCVNELLDGDFD
ncbi:MAG: regulatory protein RecX [Muribaculaceae bacterium]|nr:regulatory protein RecX [Muribaculaceae bacterium]